MAYYLEYVVPPVDGDDIAVPLQDHPEPTLPLSETDVPVVDAAALPVRSAVLASSVDEAKTAAEEVIASSKASEATLFDDPADSLEAGSGRIVAVFRGNGGWSDS